MNINESVDFIRELYGTNETIHLHEPQFLGNEKHYLNDVIESTFVSSVGEYIGKFEHLISNYTNSPAVVATANGTSAIHVALHSAGIGIGDLVITQSLSFVATCNAIRMTGADPIFVDISPDNLGLCPKSLEIFLDQNACINDSGECYLRKYVDVDLNKLKNDLTNYPHKFILFSSTNSAKHFLVQLRNIETDWLQNIKIIVNHKRIKEQLSIIFKNIFVCENIEIQKLKELMK